MRRGTHTVTARDLVAIRKTKVGDKLTVKAPGLKKVIDDVPVPSGRFIVKEDDPSVQKFIDKVMKRKGFGSRTKGRGTYDSDYWEKNGRFFRVHGYYDNEFSIEDFIPSQTIW